MIVFRLKEIAEAKDMNRHQLSMQTRVSYPTISKYWENEANSYDKEILDRLCVALDCEPGDLIKRVSVKTEGSLSPTGELVITHIPADKST